MVTNAAFEELVAPLRSDLHAHCYRMLGSVHDADDALQDTLLGAWRGFAGFEGSGSLRGYQGPDFHLGALQLVTLEGGAIAAMTGFLDPAVHRRLSLAPTDEFSPLDQS